MINEVFSKYQTVYWATIIEDGWKDLAYYSPEPVLTSIVKDRENDALHLKCPAVKDFFKNTFLVRSPVDVSFKFNSGFVSPVSKDHKLFKSFIYQQNEQRDSRQIYPSFQLTMNYLFYSKQPVRFEQLPALLSHNELTNNTKLIPGTFDISKWIRPISVGYEVTDEKRIITIKRGDPLFYFRLLPENGKTVKLERKMVDYNIKSMADACSKLKEGVRGLSLKENYEIASWRIKEFWRKHND